MQIRALKIFCDVVTRRSFSKAAEDNGITQSAASQTIHQIEGYFGAKLLDRSKRPFVVTEEGKVCFDHCIKLVRQFDELAARLNNVHSHSADTVKVASIYSVGLSYMKQFVQRFTELNPEINENKSAISDKKGKNEPSIFPFFHRISYVFLLTSFLM